MCLLQAGIKHAVPDAEEELALGEKDLTSLAHSRVLISCSASRRGE